jgi:hypothetical protein
VQVVESELQRVPAQVARRYGSQLWSMVYIPQVGACESERCTTCMRELLVDSVFLLLQILVNVNMMQNVWQECCHWLTPSLM